MEVVLDYLRQSSVSHSEFVVKESLLKGINDSLPMLIEVASSYAAAFEELDKAVGSITGEDPQYSNRDQWLTIAGSISNVAAVIKFEQAKSKAQKELQCIGDFLLCINGKQDHDRLYGLSAFRRGGCVIVVTE